MEQRSGGMPEGKDVWLYLRQLRASLTLREMSGAFGDLGTFLPLLVTPPPSLVLPIATSVEHMHACMLV